MDRFIPAVQETISDPFRQEIPQPYDIVYAKSRSFREKPGNNRWSQDDQVRSLCLQYTLPAKDLPSFLQSVVEKSNSVRIETAGGGTLGYFEDPKLLFQSHDLKNRFSRLTLEETLDTLRETVLDAFDPEELDIRSCWLDIGSRYYVSEPKTYTLLWKSQFLHQLHKQLCSLAPGTPLTAACFRSFNIEDAGTYMAKAMRTRKSNPGHPETSAAGIIKAKAYNCNKELFVVMFSDHHLFDSSFLPLLAYSEPMIKELAYENQNKQRAPITQVNRPSIERAWRANERHLKALSDSNILLNYAVRKEMTLRLDAVLTMWQQGYFDPCLNTHVGANSWAVKLDPDNHEHHPFWILPTKDVNEFIFTQAARFVLPLDHIFAEASPSKPEQAFTTNTTDESIKKTLAFYTAKLFCRLLVYSLSSEQHLQFDNWIWHSKWTVRGPRNTGQGRPLFERKGLGLDKVVKTRGMLWVPCNCIDWYNGHIALDVLLCLHIPRSPLQARIASQANEMSNFLLTAVTEARDDPQISKRHQGAIIALR